MKDKSISDGSEAINYNNKSDIQGVVLVTQLKETQKSRFLILVALFTRAPLENGSLVLLISMMVKLRRVMI